ncbi:rhodanese-like domain-containing protein, partial [Streptococcus sp. DD11]
AHYIICQKGGRSARACEFLENHGYQVTNVQGGLEAYPSEGID